MCNIFQIHSDKTPSSDSTRPQDHRSTSHAEKSERPNSFHPFTWIGRTFSTICTHIAAAFYPFIQKISALFQTQQYANEQVNDETIETRLPQRVIQPISLPPTRDIAVEKKDTNQRPPLANNGSFPTQQAPSRHQEIAIDKKKMVQSVAASLAPLESSSSSASKTGQVSTKSISDTSTDESNLLKENSSSQETTLSNLAPEKKPSNTDSDTPSIKPISHEATQDIIVIDDDDEPATETITPSDEVIEIHQEEYERGSSIARRPIRNSGNICYMSSFTHALLSALGSKAKEFFKRSKDFNDFLQKAHENLHAQKTENGSLHLSKALPLEWSKKFIKEAFKLGLTKNAPGDQGDPEQVLHILLDSIYNSNDQIPFFRKKKNSLRPTNRIQTEYSSTKVFQKDTDSNVSSYQDLVDGKCGSYSPIIVNSKTFDSEKFPILPLIFRGRAKVDGFSGQTLHVPNILHIETETEERMPFLFKSAVIFLGSSLADPSNHYVAVEAKYIDGKLDHWLLYNDSKITKYPLDSEKIRRYLDMNADIVFYSPNP